MASFKTILFVSLVVVCLLIELTTAASSTAATMPSTEASTMGSTSNDPSGATEGNSAVTCAVSLLSMTFAAFCAIFMRS